MNKIIEMQLKNVSFADLSNFDAQTNTYFIKKYSKPRYDVGRCYLVKLQNEIVNNPNTILATNWNNGRSPKHTAYKIYVNKIIGKMIQVDALAYDLESKCDLSEIFSGYLEIDTLTQICEVK